jgi:2-polyprenyl-3-methyl-5-hydroxy-6-metoxy-1,4-benzoquinol methylase
MINTSIFGEKVLQNCRFKKVKPYLIGDVLDFGGNEQELKKFVTGKYLCVNYDRSAAENCHFDTIVGLAVVEHIEVAEVYKIFEFFKKVLNANGRIILTTPTKASEPALKLLAAIGVLEKSNIDEHKHYWNKEEIYELAAKTGFKVKKYKKFQTILNQFVVLENDNE